MQTQTLTLAEGWNLASFGVDPDDPDLLGIVQPLITQNLLYKVTNETGGSIFHLPFPPPNGQWSNTIGEMSCTEGYYIKLTGAGTLSLEGVPAILPMDIPLFSGWNIMGYPCAEDQDALQVVQSLIDAGVLYKVTDETGGTIFHLPFPLPNGQWTNTIGNFENGKGYYIKVTDDATLSIGNPGDALTSLVKSSQSTPEFFEPVYFLNPFMPMHLALDLNGWMQPGDEIGVFDGDKCVGAGIVTEDSGNTLLVTCGTDDPETSDIEGFIPGNPLTILVWDNTNQTLITEVQVSILGGDQYFTPLGTLVATIENLTTGLTSNKNNDFQIRVIPNPVKDQASVVIYAPSVGFLNLSVVDILGKRQQVLFNAELEPGLHQLNFDARNLKPGVNFLKFELNNNEIPYSGFIKFVVISL